MKYFPELYFIFLLFQAAFVQNIVEEDSIKSVIFNSYKTKADLMIL